MKQKISTRVEQEIVRLAKRKAAKEGWTLSKLIQEALERYLRQGTEVSPKKRKMAFHLFCERPMKIPRAQLRDLLNEDVWTV